MSWPIWVTVSRTRSCRATAITARATSPSAQRPRPAPAADHPSRPRAISRSATSQAPITAGRTATSSRRRRTIIMRRSTTGFVPTSATRGLFRPLFDQPANQSLCRIHVHGRQDRGANCSFGQLLEHVHDQLRQSLHVGGDAGDRLRAKQPSEWVRRDLSADTLKWRNDDAEDLHRRRRPPI